MMAQGKRREEWLQMSGLSFCFLSVCSHTPASAPTSSLLHPLKMQTEPSCLRCESACAAHLCLLPLWWRTRYSAAAVLCGDLREGEEKTGRGRGSSPSAGFGVWSGGCPWSELVSWERVILGVKESRKAHGKDLGAWGAGWRRLQVHEGFHTPPGLPFSPSCGEKKLLGWQRQLFLCWV